MALSGSPLAGVVDSALGSALVIERNVRGQLRHLYPDRHELTTRDSDADFTVDLQLRL